MKTMPVPQLAKLKLGGETLDLDYFLTRVFDDVAQVTEELPAAICWLNWKRADAIQWEMIAERELKEAEATAYFELRNGGFEDKNYGGKMTDKAVTCATCLEPTVIASAKVYESRRAMRERIYGCVVALQARLDLVRTSEATRRRLQTAPPTDEDMDKMVQKHDPETSTNEK
jgi:hypothetical protein